MIETQPIKLNPEPEFYVVQIPDLLKDETDTVKNICIFMHLRYFMVPSFRGEVDHIRETHRQINKINGSFAGSEVIDNCIRFFDQDLTSATIQFEFFQ
jgi:hypothetical protein